MPSNPVYSGSHLLVRRAVKIWMTCFSFILFDHSISLAQSSHTSAIDRKSLVSRHNVMVTKADPLSSLSVGNGKFAFTVDATGLQSFPLDYAKGISLGTQSEWGWHSFPNSAHYRFEETLKTYQFNGRSVTYSVQWNDSGRNKEAANWYRQNPHRLQLGNIGFEFSKSDGSRARMSDVLDIQQKLDLWAGEIKSHFTIEGIPVEVSTFCHGEADAIAVKVTSSLISQGRIKLRLLFPYPTGDWTDEGTNWDKDFRHKSEVLLSNMHGAEIFRELDTTKYYVSTSWNGNGIITQAGSHYFLISPGKDQHSFTFTASFGVQQPFSVQQPALAAAEVLPGYDQTKASSEAAWAAFWKSGGAVDFSGSTDKRAYELERRIVLSQYLMRTQEAGSYPPQETGLTYNSWFGRPHIEMHWWHAVHYALWGRIELLEKSLGWYATAIECRGF